jgi:hypothetical protein
MAKQEAQVSEAAFLKSLNKNKQAAKVAAKAERPSGILDDAAILARLGLTAEGDRISVPARISKIQFGFAKKDANRPFFRFAYSLTDNSPMNGKGKGTIVSNYHEVTEGVKADGEVYRTIDKAYENLFFELQGCGVNTAPLGEDLSKVLEVAKKLTADKTPVQLSISVYSGSKGLGMNVTPNALVVDNSDLDEEDDSDDPDDGDSDEFDGNEWINGWVTWTDDDGSVVMKVSSYNEDSNTFNGEDEDGNEYEDAPVDQCEWLDPQPESDDNVPF